MALISHWLWMTWFGGDPSIVGRPIEVSGGLRTVIGVMGPAFRFPDTPFFPVTSLITWEPRGGSRHAAVSSFGLGGTNCHLILGEGDALHPGYQPTRQPLAPTRLQRKRDWMPWTAPHEPKDEQPPSLEKILDALDQGAIAVDQAVNAIMGSARPQD